MDWRWVLVALLLFNAVALAQTQPVDAEQERIAEKARIEREVATLPVLRADSVEQAARLSIEYDMLQAHTSLASEHREALVSIPRLKGVVCITFLGPRQPELGGGTYFDLLQRDLTNPTVGQVYTRISAYAGRINITRDSENQDWFTSVQLLQDSPPQPGIPMEELPVRLYVHQTHSEQQAPDIRMKLEAASFLLLRLGHIAEMDRYLRPILHDLQQERALFAVPDSMAWIALSSTTPPDPQLLTRIMPLIARLDADEFQERAKASEELAGMGVAVLLALASLDRSTLTPQQQGEIGAILEQSMPLTPQQLRNLANNPSFLLDVLFTNDLRLRELALTRLEEMAGRKLALTPASNVQELDQAIHRLRETVLPAATQPAVVH